MRHTLRFSIGGCALLSLYIGAFITPAPATAVPVYTAGASVNLLDIDNPPPNNFGVDAAASGGGAIARAHARGFSIGVTAASGGFNLVNIPAAGAGMFLNWTLVGRQAPGIVPLRFNMGLGGAASGTAAECTPDLPLTIGGATYAFNASVTYGIGATAIRRGSGQVQASCGSPTRNFFVGDVTANTLVTEEGDTGVSTVGYDLTFGLDALVSDAAGIFQDRGDLRSTIVCNASSTPGATGSCGFGGTLELASITVARDFNLFDISGLSVAFDNGLSIPVTREGDEPPPPGTVPEPAALGLLGMGLIGMAWLRRYKAAKR